MAQADSAIRLNARKGALRKIEFGYALVEAVAAAEVDVCAQLLRVRERVFDLGADARSGARRRNERRENTIRARRANSLLFLCFRAIDRQRQAGAISDERAVDVPRV